MVVKKNYRHGHVSFFCQKIPGKKICSTAARRSQKILFAFSKKPFFRFAIFIPAVASVSFWQSPAGCFFRLETSLYKSKPGAVGYPLFYSCRTLRGRPHKKPPMGSRSASFNADCREPAAVAKEKGGLCYSISSRDTIMLSPVLSVTLICKASANSHDTEFSMKFSSIHLLICCLWVSLYSAMVLHPLIFIPFHSFRIFNIRDSLLVFLVGSACSVGFHFRAVGLLISNSLAHADTLPPGWFLYHSFTCFSLVGPPA